MRRIAIVAAIVGVLCVPREALAYSVLAHEASIDAIWDTTIAPLLQARFPDAAAAEIAEARACDFDTGEPTARGEYSLADATYDELLDALAHRQFVDIPEALSANIVAYYGDRGRSAQPAGGARNRSATIESQVASLKAACACPRVHPP